MKEKQRQFTQTDADILNPPLKVGFAMATGIIPEAETLTIAESQIRKFCKGCDHIGANGKPCKTAGANDQARYVAREWCGWANVHGKRVVKSGPNGDVQS